MDATKNHGCPAERIAEELIESAEALDERVWLHRFADAVAGWAKLAGVRFEKFRNSITATDAESVKPPQIATSIPRLHKILEQFSRNVLVSEDRQLWRGRLLECLQELEDYFSFVVQGVGPSTSHAGHAGSGSADAPDGRGEPRRLPRRSAREAVAAAEQTPSGIRQSDYADYWDEHTVEQTSSGPSSGLFETRAPTLQWEQSCVVIPDAQPSAKGGFVDLPAEAPPLSLQDYRVESAPAGDANAGEASRQDHRVGPLAVAGKTPDAKRGTLSQQRTVSVSAVASDPAPPQGEGGHAGGSAASSGSPEEGEAMVGRLTKIYRAVLLEFDGPED